MTVNPVYTETVYPLAGANLGPFATVWPYESQSDVLVWVDLGSGPALQALNAGYTQQATGGDSVDNGGVITLLAAAMGGNANWPAGSLLVMDRMTSVSQAAALGEDIGFSPDAYEAALDHAVRQVQDFSAVMTRTLQGQPGDVFSALPPAAQRKGKVLGFDPVTGQPIVETLSYSVNTVTGAIWFSSVASASAAQVPAASPYIAVAGYAAAGDGGFALYSAAANGAGNGKFQSADGQWWSYVIPSTGVEVRALGAKGDNATNDHAAIAAAAALASNAGVGVHFAAGVYKTLTALTFNTAVTFAPGASLTVPNAVTHIFNNAICAGLQQIFVCTGTGAITAAPQFNPVGFPEWFGAVAGSAGVDCQPGIRACHVAFPVTVLQPANYWTLSTCVFDQSNRLVTGTLLPSQAVPASTILIKSATVTCAQLGPTADPGSIAAFPYNIAIERVAFSRDRAVTPPAVGSEINAPSGLVVRYVNIFKVRDCFAGGVYAHSVGFNLANCVNGDLTYNTVFRSSAGNSGVNDIYWGFGLFGIAPYFLESVNVEENNGSVAYAFVGSGTSIGISSSGAFTDCRVNRNEFNGYQYGCWVNSVGEAIASTDCEIAGNRFDQSVIYGIWYENAVGKSSARIFSNYVAMQSGGASAVAAISVANNSGIVTMGGNECYGDASTATGLKIVGGTPAAVSAVIDTGSSFTDFATPITIATANHCTINSVVHQTSQAVATAACAITGGSRHKIGITLMADAVGLVQKGVTLDAATALSEINCSGIDAIAMPGGASATKLVIAGTNIVATGVAGAGAGNNYASGVMA